jgi:hypothetical protein
MGNFESFLILTNVNLELLMDELSKPTSYNIKVSARKKIHAILLSLKLHPEIKLELSMGPDSSVAASTIEWPKDIISVRDLNASNCRLKLRSDVRLYLRALIERVFGECKFKLHYFGDAVQPPLRVEIAESHVQILIDCIAKESNGFDECELLPSDIIEVVRLRGAE